jgi:hypothetical protein
MTGWRVNRIRAWKLLAAHGGSDLVKEAAIAVETRFPGTVWTNVREKQGLREAVVCAEVAGQQVFYREKRQALFAQDDFSPEAWTSLDNSWCVTTLPR